MVNVTDEALVMQVVTCYFPRWSLGIEDMEEDDGSTIGGGVGKRGGAVKGEKNTGTRTIHIYNNYVGRAKETRASRFADLWDKKLKEEADAQHVLESMEKERIVGQDQENDTPVMKTGFDMDLHDGRFGGETEEDGDATVVTATAV